MNRCEKAHAYHKQGYNCAQSVICAFSDLTGLSMEQCLAVSGGFGGGVGGSHDELCGAISGGIMVLSLLHPHLESSNKDTKRDLYKITKEFRKRYQETFNGLTKCGDLLRAHPGLSEKTPAAAALELKAHCDIMVVTSVQIVEEMLAEEAAEN